MAKKGKYYVLNETTGQYEEYDLAAEKVPIAQGILNAGKVLQVGTDGNVTLSSGGGHKIVDEIPSVEEAEENVVYFIVQNGNAKGYIKNRNVMQEIGKNDGVPISTITYKRVSLPIPNKISITIPAFLTVAVGDKNFTSAKDVVLNLNDFVTNRAGKDLYIYACDNNGELAFVISENSTVPSGYTATTSRKIGGFHCLCANVGNIAGHALSGYAAGDILPLSVWDLLHRAVSSNEGMVYVNGKWFDIYLTSYDGSKCVSIYGGACADGESSVKFHGEKFVEMLGLVGKRLIKRSEFMVVAKGSNEQTNISGSKDYGTTGGHVDTNNRRMISNYGLEDCCGFMWQWTEDVFDSYNGTISWNSNNYYLNGYSWEQKSVYNPDIDNQGYGSCIGLLRRCLVGGDWDGSADCGSRSAVCRHFSSGRFGSVGGRSASEPRVVNL